MVVTALLQSCMSLARILSLSLSLSGLGFGFGLSVVWVGFAAGSGPGRLSFRVLEVRGLSGLLRRDVVSKALRY